MDEISKLWEDHPYVIMGVVAVILIYFLWPSSSSSSSTPVDNTAAAIAAAAQVSASNFQAQEQLAATQNTNSAAVQQAQLQSQSTIAGYQAQLQATQAAASASSYQAYAGSLASVANSLASFGSSASASQASNINSAIATTGNGNPQVSGKIVGMLLGATNESATWNTSATATGAGPTYSQSTSGTNPLVFNPNQVTSSLLTVAQIIGRGGPATTPPTQSLASGVV